MSALLTPPLFLPHALRDGCRVGVVGQEQGAAGQTRGDWVWEHSLSTKTMNSGQHARGTHTRTHQRQDCVAVLLLDGLAARLEGEEDIACAATNQPWARHGPPHAWPSCAIMSHHCMCSSV